jgi:hypothetical protein
MSYGFKDQLRLSHAYLDSLDSIAIIRAGILGDPVEHFRNHLKELEKYHKREIQLVKKQIRQGNKRNKAHQK